MPNITQTDVISLVVFAGNYRKLSAVAGGVGLGNLIEIGEGKKRAGKIVTEKLSKYYYSLNAQDRKTVDRYKKAFESATPNMRRAVMRNSTEGKRQTNEDRKRMLDYFSNKRTSKDFKTSSIPQSSADYHVWKAIMRMLYERKLNSLFNKGGSE